MACVGALALVMLCHHLWRRAHSGERYDTWYDLCCGADPETLAWRRRHPRRQDQREGSNNTSDDIVVRSNPVGDGEQPPEQDPHQAQQQVEDDSAAARTVEPVPACPNRSNPYHTCTEHCRREYPGPGPAINQGGEEPQSAGTAGIVVELASS